MGHRATQICGLAIMLIAIPTFADECSEFRATLNVREAIADALNAYARDAGTVNDSVYEEMSERYKDAASQYRAAHQRLRDSISDPRDKELAEQFNAAIISMYEAFNALGNWNQERSISLRDIAITALDSVEKADAAVQLAISCQSRDQ